MKKTLNLVLLMGGKSSRMGQDKSILKMSLLPHIPNTNKEIINKKDSNQAINMNSLNEVQNLSNDMDFFEHALFLLYSLSKANPHIDAHVKISCRMNQNECIQKRLLNLYSECNFELVLDSGVGVCEAIYMCLEKTQTPCLFIPCDTPFLTLDILQQLINIWFDNDTSHENNTSTDKTIIDNNAIYTTVLHDNTLENHALNDNILKNKTPNDSELSKEKLYVNYVFSDKNTKRKQSLISIYTQEALPYLASSIKTKMSLQKAIPEEFVRILYYNKEEELLFQNLNTINDLNDAKKISTD